FAPAGGASGPTRKAAAKAAARPASRSVSWSGAPESAASRAPASSAGVSSLGRGQKRQPRDVVVCGGPPGLPGSDGAGGLSGAIHRGWGAGYAVGGPADSAVRPAV